MGQRYLEASSEKIAENEAPPAYYVVTHEVLFTPPLAKEHHCSACKVDIEDDESDAFGVSGHGLLLFSRGDERRAEEPRLCASCGAAVGMAMLTRLQIEEEEG